MSNIVRGIMYGLTKTAYYEDLDEPYQEEPEKGPDRFTRAMLAGAGTAILGETAPTIAAAPGILQTAIQGEKGLQESKEILRKGAPFLPRTQIPRHAPLLERMVGPAVRISGGGHPLQVLYNKNPYMTAHELGHVLDKEGLRKWMKTMSTDPSFLKEYISTLGLEGRANLKGLGVLSKQFGPLKAVRALPTMLGNMVNYLVGIPLQRVPALKAALPIGAALATLASTSEPEETEDGI